MARLRRGAARGDHHAARIGFSLLAGVGLDGLVARDEAHYIDLAVALAGDTQRLADLRAGIRTRLRGSLLMDEAGFSRALEALFHQTWEQHQNSAQH